MKSISLKAPAKVNLFLDVVGKRDDGYHNIVTVFEKISLYDDIIISRMKKQGISVSCNEDIPEKENLVYKAAQAILARCKGNDGVHIRVKKRIPVASGMGGGSSDAAMTLIGINRLFGFGLTKEELTELARGVGADVPFFIGEASYAIGKDRGDNLSGLQFKPVKLWHLLIFPGVKKLTGDIYKALKLGLTNQTPDVKMLLHALRTGDLDLIKRTTYNRLEDPAIYREPGLSALKTKLTELGMKGVLLTGSGPTFFNVNKTRKEAVLLRDKIRRAVGTTAEGWQMFVASTM